MTMANPNLCPHGKRLDPPTRCNAPADVRASNGFRACADHHHGEPGYTATSGPCDATLDGLGSLGLCPICKTTRPWYRS